MFEQVFLGIVPLVQSYMGVSQRLRVVTLEDYQRLRDKAKKNGDTEMERYYEHLIEEYFPAPRTLEYTTLTSPFEPAPLPSAPAPPFNPIPPYPIKSREGQGWWYDIPVLVPSSSYEGIEPSPFGKVAQPAVLPRVAMPGIPTSGPSAQAASFPGLTMGRRFPVVNL